MYICGKCKLKQQIMGEKDYYKILGVDKNASEEDIKKAFRKMCFFCHSRAIYCK